LPVAPPPSYPSAPAPTIASKAPEINADDEFDMSFFQKIADEG